MGKKEVTIVDLYYTDGDWRRLAAQLNVPQTTA